MRSIEPGTAVLGDFAYAVVFFAAVDFRVRGRPRAGDEVHNSSFETFPFGESASAISYPLAIHGPALSAPVKTIDKRA